MRLVVQRVSGASVHINEKEYAAIPQGLLLLLGIEQQDTAEDCNWLVNKVVSLRIFNDADGKMNLSIQDIKGEFLVISQFTLYASTQKGNRPSFMKAARPEMAIPLYEKFLDLLKTVSGLNVSAGVFGADMKVHLTNDGPVTIMMDSKQRE